MNKQHRYCENVVNAIIVLLETLVAKHAGFYPREVVDLELINVPIQMRLHVRAKSSLSTASSVEALL